MKNKAATELDQLCPVAKREVCLTLPIPPSVNSSYINARGRGRVSSPTLKKFKKDAANLIRICQPQWPFFDKAHLEVEIVVLLRPKDMNRRDTDNFVKACLDVTASTFKFNDVYTYRLKDIIKHECPEDQTPRCIMVWRELDKEEAELRVSLLRDLESVTHERIAAFAQWLNSSAK